MSDREMNISAPGGKRISGFGATGTGSREPATFEAAVVGMLGQLPDVPVPEKFAARVAGLAVAQPLPVRSVWAGFGPRIALGSVMVLLVALFVFAAHATPSFLDLRFDLELLLLVELSAVALLVPHLTSRD